LVKKANSYSKTSLIIGGSDSDTDGDSVNDKDDGIDSDNESDCNGDAG
jgi:hypothetical protein